MKSQHVIKKKYVFKQTAKTKIQTIIFTVVHIEIKKLRSYFGIIENRDAGARVYAEAQIILSHRALYSVVPIRD